jgi:hypothetical protein
LVGLLLADVDAQENTPTPHSVLAEIIDLSIDRAEIFIYLLFQVRARPRLLADLVIHPQAQRLRASSSLNGARRQGHGIAVLSNATTKSAKRRHSLMRLQYSESTYAPERRMPAKRQRCSSSRMVVPAPASLTILLGRIR